jgi:anti-sigma B factor antagonist
VDADGMHVDVSFVDGLVIVTIEGELDAVSAPALGAALDELQPSTQVVLNMSGVEFIDSTGLRVILEHATHMCEATGSLRIRTASPRVHRLLHITNLDSLLERDPAA